MKKDDQRGKYNGNKKTKIIAGSRVQRKHKQNDITVVRMHTPLKIQICQKNRYLVKFSNQIFYVTFSTALALLSHKAARFQDNSSQSARHF